jgi:ferredoxin/flavodoxin
MRVGLFYFSGTGNTELVTELLARAFAPSGADVEDLRIEELLRGEKPPDLRRYDWVGVGFPVIGFGAPRNVGAFLRRLPAGEGKGAFVYATAGDFLSINHGAFSSPVRCLRAKGYDVVYERLFCMGANFLVKYPDPFTKQLYEAAVDKTRRTVEDILAGRRRVLRRGPLIDVLTALVHACEDLGARFYGKDLRVSQRCVDCGRCVSGCPVGNVARRKGRIRFGFRCVTCMRCVYACPTGALRPRLLRAAAIQGGYDPRRILADPAISSRWVTGETRGYFRHFLAYLRDPNL